MGMNKTFDNLKNGDLVLYTEYDREGAVKLQKVLRVKEAPTLQPFSQGGKCALVKFTGLEMEATLPPYASKWEQHHRKTSSPLSNIEKVEAWETVTLSNSEIETIIDDLFERGIEPLKSKLSGAHQSAFNILEKEEMRIFDNINTLSNIKYAREYYSLYDQIYTEDGKCRTDLTASELQEKLRVLKTMDYTFRTQED